MQTTAPARPKKSTNVRLPMLALQTTFRTLGTATPGLAARLAEHLWSRPPKAPVRPEHHAALARAKLHRLPVEEMDLALYSWGEEGPAALLVHGWGGHAGQLTPLVEPLRQHGFRVLALDAPCHGSSRGGSPTLLHYGRALAAVARFAGGIEAVAAHSMGAAAVSWGMSEHGLAAKRAVFLAPSGDMKEASLRFASLLAIPAPVRDEMQRRFERRLGVTWDRFRVPAVAPAMRAQLLVIHDAGDREVPVQEGAAIAADWPGAKLIRTNGLGHHRLLRDAATVAETADFLRHGHG